MNIGGRKVGAGEPTLIVAELSGNAGKDFETAVTLIKVAKDAGADAIKTQCFTPDAMTLPLDTSPFRVKWQGRERTLYDLYSETAMPLEWHSRLKELAESLGMIYFASVFDKTGVDFMDALGVPCFKIASFEFTDLPLIRYAASKGKQVILSTGMASTIEIDNVVRLLWEFVPDYTPPNAILLKCTSAYPADASAANLKTLSDLAEWEVPVGISDHTLEIAIPVVAVALGAGVIEKHLTLSRSNGGPDAAFSLEPDELKAMVDAVRIAEKAIGTVRYGPTESEREMLKFRRSLWVVRDVRRGEVFTSDNVKSLRPADGLPPGEYDKVLGRTAKENISAGTPLRWELTK